MVGAPTFGDYRVDEADLTLAQPVVAPATFYCDRVGCDGTFSLSDRAGNPVDLNLNWLQTTLSTGSAGGGGLFLSNGSAGLGGIRQLDGYLYLDSTKSTGTMRLVGYGEDAFGGSFASATFDLHGTVDRWAP